MNVPSSEVYAATFDECRTTPDGLFLLPGHFLFFSISTWILFFLTQKTADNVIAIPVQQTHFDQMARLYDSYEAFKHAESLSINVAASGGAHVGPWSGY